MLPDMTTEVLAQPYLVGEGGRASEGRAFSYQLDLRGLCFLVRLDRKPPVSRTDRYC
jgi:hypothetical protein